MKNGAFLVFVATFGLALKGIWARLAYAAGAEVSVVLFYRSLLSAPLVALSGWLLLRQQPNSGPKGIQPLVPGFLLGGLFAFGMVADFVAIEKLGASVSRVILFGFPLLVMSFEALATGQSPPRHRLVGFAIAWIGLTAVALGSGLSASLGFAIGDQISDTMTKVVWALVSMFIYAVYVFLSGRYSKTMGSVRLTLVSNLTTAALVVFILLILGAGQMPTISPQALKWIGLMVLVSTVGPYFLLMEGIRRLGAARASLLTMSGPVVTIAAGATILGERLSPAQLLGTVLTLVGVAGAEGKLNWRGLSRNFRGIKGRKNSA